MKTNEKQAIRTYLATLSDEELDQIELEVLQVNDLILKGNYLKEINDERQYRSFKKEYDKIKNGEGEVKDIFINTNPVNILLLNKKYQEGKLVDYLEGFTPEQLKQIEISLVEKYHFYINDPIVKTVREEYQYLKEIADFKGKYITYNIKTLLELYSQGNLIDYLKELSDEELEFIYLKVVKEIMNRKDDLDIEKIDILDEIINEKDLRDNNNMSIERKLK